MDIRELERNWDQFGKTDPLWAVLTVPEKLGNQWNIDEFFQTGQDDVARIFAAFETQGVAVRRGRALDFGCAVGRLTQALGDRFEEVVGVDIAASMLELARAQNRHGARCRYVHNTVDNLSVFRDAEFDFALTLITLQHMRPQYIESYLKEFLRILAPGGVLFFQLPAGLDNALNAKMRLRNRVPGFALKIYYQLRHGRQLPIQAGQRGALQELYGMEPGDVRAILEAAGGKVLDVTRTAQHETSSDYQYTVLKPE